MKYDDPDYIQYVSIIFIYTRENLEEVFDTDYILAESLIEAQIESETFIKCLKKGLIGKYKLFIDKTFFES